MIENIDSDKQFFLQHSGWLTYLGIMAISLWGGLVSYFEKKEKFAWATFVVHLLSSSFAGMMTYFACEAAGISGPLIGVACGIAAHMGTPKLVALAMKLKVVRNFLVEDKKE